MIHFILQTRPTSCLVSDKTSPEITSVKSHKLAKGKTQDSAQVGSVSNVSDIPPKALPRGTKTAFIHFINSLNLDSKYPQKLNLADALTIRIPLLDTGSMRNEIHMLPYLVLQKIMMYDNYRPLCKLMSKKISQFNMHPVDILLALLHCCDDILRQDLFSRLHTCKLAIPFLLPHPNNKTITFLLWAMRSIVCEWKCKTGEHIASKESRIVDYKGPIVSFLRVGSVKSPKDFSKSRILNMVIGEQNYFFHWNCPGGSFGRNFVNGLVELACYLPSGKDTDNFPDFITFLNLRGEVRSCIPQLKFIKKIAFSAFVLFLEESINDGVLNLIEELAVLPGGLVLIFPDYEYTQTLQNSRTLLKTINEKKIVLFDIKDKNEDEIKSGIQEIITEKIRNSDWLQFLTISECSTIAQKIGIRVDEDKTECKEGRASANRMIQSLNKASATEAKGQMLPLQGPELWHKWAKHDKESFQKPKTENLTVAIYNKNVEQEKDKIRQKQLNYVEHLTPLMKDFTSSLQRSKNLVRTYTLLWLKLFLDDRSRKILPGMRSKYEKIRKELKGLKSKSGFDGSAENNLINELKKQNRLLIEGSLGLEHLFREIGQMYEAVKHHTNQKNVVDCYPKIIVEILNQGYPVELMDGDASHVPVTWVSAILDQLISFHKKKRLFVISVLGIQSTGKSTMLNTMFGLQFNVSAGRCTRGAFMQLLPVEATLPKSSPDYVLLVDTEGLRAPELSSIESVLHDNELATFVIGLADVAIINIYGESPGDLNDILQTAVHAFIRMKNVSVNLRCHFVHQNVTSLLVDSKIKFGQQAFQDKLDNMTKYAAIAEHCESKYSKFQDVIKFDETTDITYFPGLWKGDPPMAPVNPGYSDKALQLKSALMNLVNTRMKNDASFSSFQTLLKTLWISVCRENYIFSFKNTQEVIAYNDLDAAFSQWSWTLHRKMLEWRYQTGNTISNCPPGQVTAAVTECLKNVDNMLQETYNKLSEEMKEFFENSERSDTLAQWRARYKIRLQSLKEDCKIEAVHQCKLLKLNREGHLKLEANQTKYRKQLLQHIDDLVVKAKKNNFKLSHQDLESRFNDTWKVWMEEFSTEQYQKMYVSNDQIVYSIFNVLQDLLNKDDSILMPKLEKVDLSKGTKKLCITIDPKKHLNLSNLQPNTSSGVVVRITTFIGFNKDNSRDQAIKCAQKASDDFFAAAKDSFRKIRNNFQNFNRSYVFNLLKELIDSLTKYNEENEQMLTSEYIVDMALIYAKYLADEFIKLMNEVRITNDPMESFKRLRETYFNTFIAQYKDISGDVTSAKSLSQVLSVAIETAIIQILPAKIADDMKSKDQCFIQKKYLKVRVLKDLAKEKNFELYKTYLVDIKSSYESWIQQYVKEFCKTKDYITLARTTVHGIVIKITATIADLGKNIPIEQWLLNFHERLNDSLTINFSEMQDIIGATTVKSSSDYFIDTLSEQLSQVEEEIMQMITRSNSKFSDITEWSNSPHIILCNSLIGCTEQCPFCKEQCEINDPNHADCEKDHFIHIHRPECLGRMKWHKSKELVLDLCTYSIESDNTFRNNDTNNEWVPYKDYRNIYKNWCISNESPIEAPKYWQWFIYNYRDEITTWAGATSTSIDHLGWGAVSLKMAVASLSEVYKLTT